MKKFILFIFLAISFSAFSQGVKTAKNVTLDFSGFVRNDIFFDSRRNVDALDHLVELYPKRPVLDANGNDLNEVASTTFLGIFSRFGTRVSGLQIGEAKLSAYLEADFAGGTRSASLRLRHAYTKVDWSKTSLMIGNYWHPMFVTKVFPSTLNENTGMPFQAFNRSPQIKVTHSLSQNLSLIGAAIYQYQYVSRGPSGKTNQYQLDAVVPNLHAQLQFDNSTWVTGFGLDWKMIQPRTQTEGTEGVFRAAEQLGTVAMIAYLKYAKDKFMFKTNLLYGQNVHDYLLPGGYAVASTDPRTGAETYTPSNNIYNWVNFMYGGNWKVGFFAGWQKNLGFSENPVGTIYGIATDTDMIYRVAPSLRYIYKNFTFGVEASITTALYGDINRTDKGKVENTESVTNFRNMFSVIYAF